MFKEMFDLTGRRAFVTGGGRGIGLAAAHALLEYGARVVLSDRDPAVLEAGLSALGAAGFAGAVEAVVLDVTDAEAVERAATAANADAGIDILVANAGIATPDAPGEEISDAEWRRVLDVDLNGCFWSCRAFGRAMLSRGRGVMVTVGSMSGTIANKPQRQAHYNAAKAAVHHLTRSLAGEWATRGVRVNAVAPTYVDTEMSRHGFSNPALYPVWMDMTPMRRVARPEEVASVILFLASDASSAMTGAVVPVDCGYTVW